MSETGSVPTHNVLQPVKLGDALLRPIVFSRPVRLVEPTSWATHIPFAFWLVEAVAPRTVVELGTMSGNSFAALAQAVQTLGLDAACYCVDTWKGDAHAGFFGEEVFEEWSAFHDRHFGAFSRVVRSTFDEALTKFEDGSVDLLHIDGFHTYEAVHHDFEAWLPKLSPRAVVILHDVNVRERDFGVWRFWEELKDRYPSFSFLHGHGLGVVGVGRELPTSVRWLFERVSPDGQSSHVVRQFFGTLGEALVGLRRETVQAEMRTALLHRLGEKEAETARLTTELDARLKENDAQLKESDARLRESDTRLKESDAQLRDATRELTAKRSHADSARTISVLRAELGRAQAERTTLDEALFQAQEEITELTQQNAAQAAHHVALLRELDAVHTSKSWRWTAPLRNARRTLTGLNPLTQFVPAGKTEGLQTGTQPAPNSFPAGDHEGRGESRSSKGPPGLPEEFVHAEYLALNPDVAASGVDPADHYLSHGRYEGRAYYYPAVELSGKGHILADRDSVLVVSHEASRTGAPMVSLNLISNLASRYNVVALLLDGGPLVESFEQAGAVTVVSHLRRYPMLADNVVGRLHDRFRFSFAFVNSIESRVVLRALAVRFVPIVSLVHEFAAYTRPRDAFPAALLWSTEVVFSANIARNSVLQDAACSDAQSLHTIPQGRCVVPGPQLNGEELENESERLKRWMRPEVFGDDLVIVLGAGSVHLRKGVDLFIEIAARVVSAPGGAHCRFVWLGAGYDPDGDVGYSAYLADQIQRAGLEEHLFVAGETAAIETAYMEADIFLMSSRLDPMPNVAIDALAHGKPVLCFDRATGIADFLRDCGLGDRCIARYLDTGDMADKIQALANSRSLRQEVGEKGREASICYFNMTEYVTRLEALALKAVDRSRREEQDVELILGSGLFRPDFAVPPNIPPLSLDAGVQLHVRSWASGIGRRKPFPGFHPGIYLDQHGVAVEGSDPTADYIREGKPDGEWNSAVISPGVPDVKYLPANESVALHLHAFYPDLLPEIMAGLSSNRCRPDLLVSVTSEEARDEVVRHLESYEGKVAAIEVVPNRGRDVGPFLTQFGQRILSEYIYVGHMHTKKTEALGDKALGKTWFKFLMKNLLGGRSGAMADAILAAMAADPSIGIAFPDDPNAQGWNANRGVAEELASKIGITKLPQYFNFPVGTMFWARTSALSPLIEVNFQWDDYPQEPLPYDGTLLHAIERLLPFTSGVGTLRSAVTNVTGVTR